MPVNALNQRQKRFAKRYATTGNATTAAREAGYANPNRNGSRLLSNDGVKEYIDGLVARADDAAGLTPDAILAGLTEIASDSTAKHADKLRALELIGKHRRMFADVQVTENPDDKRTIEGLEGLIPADTLEALKKIG